jgi:hypothetical protein
VPKYLVSTTNDIDKQMLIFIFSYLAGKFIILNEKSIPRLQKTVFKLAKQGKMSKLSEKTNENVEV